MPRDPGLGSLTQMLQKTQMTRVLPCYQPDLRRHRPSREESSLGSSELVALLIASPPVPPGSCSYKHVRLPGQESESAH